MSDSTGSGAWDAHRAGDRPADGGGDLFGDRLADRPADPHGDHGDHGGEYADGGSDDPYAAPPDDGYGTPAAGAGSGGTPPGGPPPGSRRPRGSGPGGPRRRRRRRRRWIALIATGTFTILVLGSLVAVYVATRIPLPGEVVNPQTSVLTYSDGRTELARVFAQNRTEVRLSKVPLPVQHAVLAAENRSFYRDPGFDWKGIGRAVWNDVRGRDVQGGSTITQQYVKNAYLTQERTFTRKFKELVISIKMERQYSKSQILEWYLNTIYFGRGAYGIEAAAETYFGKHVDQLSTAEGAVLASSIRSPATYDPETHPDRARARWTFVLDGMVKEGWLSPEDRGMLAYPKVLPRGASPGARSQLAGPQGYVVGQVKEELGRLGIPESDLNRAGLRVRTTIDKRAQDAAVTAVNTVFHGQPKNLRQALVAVDPRTGGVIAYYGGPNGTGFDYAQAWRAPGSSFKPYTLATALEGTLAGRHLDQAGQVTDLTRFDGTSPRTFQGVQVHNSENAQCPNCTVLEAMKRSINTVFYDMALQVGPKKVADLAHRMGIPTHRTDDDKPTLQVNGTTDGSIGIGRYEVRPIDQAGGFATFAAGGVRHPTHFVQKVTDSKGKVLYDATNDDRARGTRVLDPKVANDVTVALEPVAAWSHDPLADGRQSASKTGTQQLGETADNQDAWMVGYTPKVSTAVWVGTDHNEPLRNAAGRIVFGSGLPGKTWQAFMDAWLSGTPQDSLPTHLTVHGDGGTGGGNADDGGTGNGPTTTPTTGNHPTDRPSPSGSPTPPSGGGGPTGPTGPTTSNPAPTDTGRPGPPTVPVPTLPGPTPTPSQTPPGGGGAGDGGAEAGPP